MTPPTTPVPEPEDHMPTPQAPAAPRRRLPLILEQLPTGGLLITSTALPGWAVVAAGPHSLTRLLDEAWTELQIVEYARARRQAYDAAHLHDGHRDPVKSYAHAPTDWRPLPDGTWQSPSGRHYSPTSAQVVRVVAKLAAAGHPTTHPDTAAAVS